VRDEVSILVLLAKTTDSF